MVEYSSKMYHAHHNAERWTGFVLRLGVWVSALLMIVGLILAALHPSVMGIYSGNPTFGELFSNLFSKSFDPTTVLFVGLIFLMFTPVLRVFTAIIGFALERDWRFVLVSCIVFFLLTMEIIYSIFLKG